MPKCSLCRFEGPYNIDSEGSVTMVAKDGAVEMPLKYMKCKAPGGGPTQDPISNREALTDMPCEFYEPREQPKESSGGIMGFFKKLFGGGPDKKAKFKEKTVQGKFTYEIYTAAGKDDAMEFLKAKTTPPDFYYIVVETPEGNWGLDRDGIYQES